jgi:hypothetical protein
MLVNAGRVVVSRRGGVVGGRDRYDCINGSIDRSRGRVVRMLMDAAARVCVGVAVAGEMRRPFHIVVVVGEVVSWCDVVWWSGHGGVGGQLRRCDGHQLASVGVAGGTPCFTIRRGSRGVEGGDSVWFQGADGSIDRGGGRDRVGVELHVVVPHLSWVGVTMIRTHFVLSSVLTPAIPW